MVYGPFFKSVEYIPANLFIYDCHNTYEINQIVIQGRNNDAAAKSLVSTLFTLKKYWVKKMVMIFTTTNNFFFISKHVRT